MPITQYSKIKTMLKKIVRPHAQAVTEEWRRLHCKEHHNLNRSPELLG
jgi:hypothetical protein